MGNPLVKGVAKATDADRLRIVVLSPFFFDEHEVTVRDARASGDFVGVPWTGAAVGANPSDWCTFTSAEGPKDDLPVTCMDWSAASAYCQKRGARLPTEAEHEYVAGAFEARLFPWGNAEPACDDAIWGRGGVGVLKFHPNRCPLEGGIGSQEPPGSGARDRVAVGSSWVLDLAGNVVEWTRDRWNSQDEPCWATPGVYHDPVCELPSAALPDRRSTRGGAFAFDAVFMASAARGRELEVELSGLVGFRCARSAVP
jgi:formylglycine-generating enzyme required for sulfatase activity